MAMLRYLLKLVGSLQRLFANSYVVLKQPSYSVSISSRTYLGEYGEGEGAGAGIEGKGDQRGYKLMYDWYEDSHIHSEPGMGAGNEYGYAYGCDAGGGIGLSEDLVEEVINGHGGADCNSGYQPVRDWC